MKTWGWRTKPRSIIRTVQWFRLFGKLEGNNWDEEDETQNSSFLNKKIHPIRRKYNFQAHSEENQSINRLSFEEYVSGKFDKNEAEGDARNDKSTYEFFGFGYVDEKGIIKNTEVGNLILTNRFDGEDFLKQMLKIYFPNPVYFETEINKSSTIFPMKLILLCLQKFEYLNRSEMIFLFGCTSDNDIDKLFNAITEFRTEYSKDNIEKDSSKLCQKIFIKNYGDLKNKIESFYDYADAFARALTYTEIFKNTGRGCFAKIRFSDCSKEKIKLLLKNYKFENKEFRKDQKEEYMQWFGNINSTELPWNNVEDRKKLVNEKIEYLENLKSIDHNTYIKTVSNELKKSSTDNEVKNIEKNIVTYITTLNEKTFILTTSHTTEAKNEILERFNLIKQNDDLSALWLEVNTWKSLIAISGEKNVKRNFKIEEDLTPKSFAPGIGNTPDMELYFNNYIILPEVSLMTGVQQWEHEGSSVIEHVYRFINTNKDKKVLGLFISTSINIRTKWQFFILNRESWIGQPVPVIPMTIDMYTKILKIIYSNDIEIQKLIDLLTDIQKLSIKSSDFNQWYDNSENTIQKWSEEVSKINQT